MDVVLEIKALNKKYGGNHALKDFTYTLTEGVYGLLGPNGAGKSTLMNIITDNLLPDHGQILFNGKDVKKMGKDFLQIIGYMPQQQGVYDTFTAARFLFYMAALKGMTKKEAKEQIPKLLSLVNLQDHTYKRLGYFSGGMKQRILIAQAMLGNPKVLILDEPTAGLDPKERIRIRNLISEISFDKIVLIATHVVPDIEFIAKEVLLLNKGTLLDSGSPHYLTEKMQGCVFEIKTSPENLPAVASKYRVGNISKDSNNIYVRIVSDKKPDPYEYEEVRPTLEDVYLHYFDTEGQQ
ncbi:MAG TPA: ABC transporter ATP-binding protein [Bacillaceae bacterium]|nr:ABC transporter ATP-binding protein [Paenibacillus bovis]HLU23470.1 ABC transporter ATP-binding protein [Bacillaceae bacterium]